MVKGNAYGHGAIEIAQALEDAGVDGLCVATIDEALALRRAGMEVPILVLFPVPSALAGAAARERIAVTASDPALLDALLDALAAGLPELPLEVHLEVETGLGRGGFDLASIVAAGRRLAESNAAHVAGAWTHFQAPEDLARTSAQSTRFAEATDALAAAGIEVPRRHAAASGGLLLGNVASLDGVRPGLALYGLVPDGLGRAGTPATAPGAEDLRPILALYARPVRVAEVPAGWGISYGPSFTTSRPSRIATLPLGYGDGWSRSLANRASALVRGGRVPLVGNVAMDAVMADVTDVPGPPVGVDDEFVLIGAQGEEAITVGAVADERGTNAWEVVTNLSARLPRVYHAASVPRQTRTLVVDEVGDRRPTRP